MKKYIVIQFLRMKERMRECLRLFQMNRLYLLNLFLIFSFILFFNLQKWGHRIEMFQKLCRQMIPAQYIDEHNSPNNIAFIKYAKNCNTSPLLKTRNETKIIPIPICHFSIFSDMNIEIFPPVTVHHTAACLLSQKYQHLDQHLHFSIFVKTLLFFF